MTTARDTAAEKRLDFPEGFTWGVATAAHQIEGGNVNNDWWAWEHDPDSGTVASSGDACDSFHRWREDVDLVGELGLTAYRFSLEWSRIEPAEGEFSLAALEHARGYLRHELALRLNLRHVPELHFGHDRSQDVETRIDFLLRRAKKSRGRTENKP